MKHPVDDQLRRYAGAVVAGLRPVGAAETTVTRLRPVAAARRPSWVVATAVAVTLAVGGGLAVVVSALRSGSIPAGTTTAAPAPSSTEPTSSITEGVPSPGVPAVRPPDPLPGWAREVVPLVDLHRAAGDLATAVNRLPAVVVAVDDFDPVGSEWLARPPMSGALLAVGSAEDEVGDAARRLAAHPVFVTLTADQRAAVETLAAGAGDGRWMDDLDRAGSVQEALTVLATGGEAPPPRDGAAEIVGLLETVLGSPPAVDPASLGACPAPAPLPGWASGDPLYEDLHAAAVRLIDEINRLVLALPDEAVMAEGWTQRSPAGPVVAAIREATADLVATASAVLTDLGLTFDDGRGVWIVPAAGVDFPGRYVFLEFLTDHSDQGVPVGIAVMESSLAHLDTFRERDETVTFLFAIEEAAGTAIEFQPCFEATGLIELVDSAFEYPEDHSPPAVGTCPMPQPMPVELAADDSLSRLYQSIGALADAVNRLPAAVGALDDFSEGWTSRAPAVGLVDEIRASAAAVASDGEAVLSGLDGVPAHASPIEELSMIAAAALDESLAALDDARSSEAALSFLASGRGVASPCGWVSTIVMMFDTAIGGWPAP